MIIIDYIKQLKEKTNSYESFFDLLTNDNISKLFRNIEIEEKDNLLHLKYNTKKMFDLKWNEFYSKTRGIVIDWKTEKIILYPFDKFFELDEQPGYSLKKVKELYNKSNIKELTTKLDGTLVSIRYYNNEFFIATMGTLDGPHIEIAKQILDKDIELQNFIKAYKDYTIICEMKNTTYPQIVKYNENSLNIIGMRNMNNYHLLYRYEIIELAKDYNINIVKQEELTLDEVIKKLDDNTIDNFEGYVLRLDNFFVKLKTTNYKMANRFMSDPLRNINMVITAINENRLEAIKNLIRKDFMVSFDITYNFITRYLKEKIDKIDSIYKTIPENYDMNDFCKFAKEKYPKYVDNLIAKKVGRDIKLDKTDINFIKTLADYFICTSHYKYAKKFNIPLELVEKDIIDGKIKYISTYKDGNGKIGYILQMWQFKDLDNIHYN